MLQLLKDWKGAIEIDSTRYNSIADVPDNIKQSGDDISIKLYSYRDTIEKVAGESSTQETETSADTVYRIVVKKYMTKKAMPNFDFMAQWNNNNPMPMVVMYGTKEKETRGLVYMKLHGKGEKTITCMRCGKELTNPISRLYGIGPECIKHIPVLADYDIANIADIQNKLADVTWEGWVVKSAILEETICEQQENG